MSIFSRLLRRSLLYRMGLLIGAITLLALLSALTSATVAEVSTGQANAINSSGSLRMLAWRMVSEADGSHLAQLNNSVRTFDHRLEALKDSGIRLAMNDRPLLSAYQQINAEWHNSIRPLIRSGALDANGSQHQNMLEQMSLFVSHLDTLVTLIETDLETKIQWLRWIHGTLLIMIVGVASTTLLMMKRHVIAPLRELLAAAQAVRQGKFDTRIRHQKPDELGQLGITFNTMVQTLSDMYGRLEALVTEKTSELQHSNRSLELLYRTTSRLSDSELTQDKLLDLLKDVEQELGLGQGILCVRQNDEQRAYPLATHIPEPERAELCNTLGCSICFGTGHDTGLSVHQLGAIHLVSVPLTGGGQWQGVMPFQLLPGSTLEPWQAQVLETLGRHVATALANTRRAEERHRLAVYEERSVIARELHDSIAQSLSYLKIQIALLQSRLDDVDHPELLKTVNELKVGLGMAYSELRELLTTFRLSPGQTPFMEELAQMISELSRRCGFTIELDQHMDNMELSANEEIHLTSIIREALINVQHHAKASWARVILTCDTLRRVHVLVEDNGIGMAQPVFTHHHYGLTIMRDRAAILQGQIQIESRPEGGTRVDLSFVANTPYAHERRTS